MKNKQKLIFPCEALEISCSNGLFITNLSGKKWNEFKFVKRFSTDQTTTLQNFTEHKIDKSDHQISSNNEKLSLWVNSFFAIGIFRNEFQFNNRFNCSQ